MIPPKNVREPLVPSVRGNEAQAQKTMLKPRKKIAKAVGIPAISVHWLGFGAYTAKAPNMAVDSGNTKERRESAEAIQPSCLSRMY